MTYQHLSDVPKKGPTEYERRVESQLQELSIPYATNQVFCFACRHISHNPSGNNYPSHCPHCYRQFDGEGQYCLPDFVIEKTGILNINGGVHTKNKKHIQKDRNQIAEIKAASLSFFVLENSEMDYMTNSSLRLYLIGVYEAVQNPGLNLRAYRGEKDYFCLR